MLKRVVAPVFQRGMEWEDGLAITEQIGALVCVSGLEEKKRGGRIIQWNMSPVSFVALIKRGLPSVSETCCMA